MRIAVLSDTHDNIPKIEEAVALFNKLKVDFLFHCGDYVAPFSLVPFDKLSCDYMGVFGNNDGEKEGLSKKSGNRIKKGPIIVKKDDSRILVTHDILAANSKKTNVDLVLYGHSHKSDIKVLEGCLFVNPGECGGWLYGKSTVAVIDLCAMSAKIIRL